MSAAGIAAVSRGSQRLARNVRSAPCMAAMIAGSLLVGAAGCSSSHHGSGRGSAAGCGSAPSSAVAKLKASLEPGATVTGLVSHKADVDFAGSVDFLAARVSTTLHGFKPTTATADWVWDGHILTNFRGTAEIATPMLANFTVAGGGTDEARGAADACLARTLSEQPQSFTVPTFDPHSNPLRVSGALNGTISGAFTCIASQADGQFHIGSSELAVSISDGIAVSVINPPGGAKLWVFQDFSTGDGLSGVSVEAAGVRLHISVPSLQGVNPLVFDGTLPCR